jgi:hypothetical protein
LIEAAASRSARSAPRMRQALRVMRVRARNGAEPRERGPSKTAFIIPSLWWGLVAYAIAWALAFQNP